MAKDKISKLLGLSTLQGSKHNTARDRPWYAQGSCLCDGLEDNGKELGDQA